MKVVLHIDEIAVEGIPVNDRDGLRRSLQLGLERSLRRQFSPGAQSGDRETDNARRENFSDPTRTDALSDIIVQRVGQTVQNRLASAPPSKGTKS